MAHVLFSSIIDLGFHREHSNINVGGPPVQTRSHTKYISVQPHYNTEQGQNNYLGQGYRHEANRYIYVELKSQDLFY